MDARLMVDEIKTLPGEVLSDWDLSFVTTCEQVLDNGEALDARRLEKLRAVHEDRTKAVRGEG